MKALTVQQPWAWAIFHGKDIENRTWATTHRGMFAIHAGARLSERGCELLPDLLDATSPDQLAEYAETSLVYSAIIGVAQLPGIHIASPEMHAFGDTYAAACCDSPWGEQAYVEHPTGKTRRDIHHWELAEQTLLEEPIPCKGKLGLWTLDNLLVDQIREQLPIGAVLS